MNGGHILVLGDLCWDINVDDIELSSFRNQVQRSDIASFDCQSRLEVGGSAWLFAKEVIDAGRETPLVIASVGSDPSGDQLIRHLDEAGLRTALIHRSPQPRTDLICVVRFGTSGRLMLVPRDPANDDLSPHHVSFHLDQVDPRAVRWAWISGYALAKRGSKRRTATSTLADWCHANDVPIALDLVPHDFRARVGGLDEVMAYLGGVDLLVGAPSTLQELGYGRHSARADVLDQMRAAARSAADKWGNVLVQTHTSDLEFGQVLYGPGGHELFSDQVSVADGVRGAGDRLAVRALQWLR